MDAENELKIAKSILKKFIVGDCVTDDEIIDAFPDLAESEDEKTRKDIRKLIESFAQGKDKHRFYTWIDKQEEWSKEDQEMLDRVTKLIEHFDSLANDPTFAGPKFTHPYKKEIEWLKSFHPQRSCADCSKHLEGYISGRIDSENKLLDQFGALITPEGELHMKPRWKPSDENIHAIGLAIANLNPIGHYSLCDELNELRDNLLKLK